MHALSRSLSKTFMVCFGDVGGGGSLVLGKEYFFFIYNAVKVK